MWFVHIAAGTTHAKVRKVCKLFNMTADPRHQKRQATVQELFAYQFNNNQATSEYTRKIIDSIERIDPLISKTAPDWPVDKLNKIDLAILRLAIYEIIVDKKEPVKVIIDEAVELAKELGSESSSSFVNGVLGTIVKEMAEKE